MEFLKKIVVWLLTLESRLILAKYKPFIVAVTGSVGKTSTKDAIYSVLKDRSPYVRKSDKSMNSEIGLPLTVIGVPNAWKSLAGWLDNLMEGLRLIVTKSEYPDTLVLEIGADHPGDIRRVASWLRADIVVVTQVSDTPVHVEFFASPEQVFEEKASLTKALKDGGTLVLLADNAKVMTIADRVKGKNPRVISFGTVDGADVKGSGMKVVYSPSGEPTGLAFSVQMDGASHGVTLEGIAGKSYMFPLLAAAAVGRAKGLSAADVVAGLNSYDAPKGRMNLIPGINGSTIVDDTYNSSPDAVVSALSSLRDMTIPVGGSKIAALADMMELGQYSSEEHRRIGRELGGVDRLAVVGQRSRSTAEEAVASGFPQAMVSAFDDSTQAGEFLKGVAKQGDVILVKGSQSMRMERTVKALMRDPSRAEELLVRQEKEWLDKK